MLMQFHTWVTRTFFISAKDNTLVEKVVVGENRNHLLFIGCEVNDKVHFRTYPL